MALGCAGVVVAGMAEAQARDRAPARRNSFTKDIVVTLYTPTLNQEVLSDLSDPGLNGRITVRFSSPPRKRDIIDNQNPFNRLTTKVEFFDSTFQRLPGEPRVRKNVFTFVPFIETQPVLPIGQYTLNVKRSVRNNRGRLLNNGVADFTTTFSVGTDVHNPVLRRLSPVHRQTAIGLGQKIRATFNEPIDLSSLIATILVQDGTTNPPTAIPGAGGTGISIERNGFDVVFTPDPCFGYPPKTLITFQMQGENDPGYGTATPGQPSNTSPVTDVFGNGFRLDSGLQWSENLAAGVFESPNGVYDLATGQFRMEFETKGVKPAPQALSPGSQYATGTPIANPCSAIVYYSNSCFANGMGIHYTTSNGLGEISLIGIINRFNQGVTDLSLLSLVPNTPVRMGRPGGMMVDPRWDTNTLHTFLYMVDERSASVAVIDSRNFKILGRFAGFSSPRDLAISTTFNRITTTLWVSDFSANQIIGLDLQQFVVSFTGQPGQASPCEAINDKSNAQNRIVVDVGQGPSGIAADSYLNARVMVCNTLENSVSVVDVQQAKIKGEYEVGSTPVDCDWGMIAAGAIPIGLVANQGGLNDPDGSISVYLENLPIGASRVVYGTRSGVENTFTDNVKNPSMVFGSHWIDGFGYSLPGGGEFIVPNTGGNDVSQYTWTVLGGTISGLTVTVAPSQTYEVGLNPTSAVYDPYYGTPIFLFASVAGQGAVAAIHYFRSTPPVLTRVPGVRRLWTCYTH
jgi:hypothetical protein